MGRGCSDLQQKEEEEGAAPDDAGGVGGGRRLEILPARHLLGGERRLSATAVEQMGPIEAEERRRGVCLFD